MVHDYRLLDIDETIQVERHFELNHNVMCEDPANVLQLHKDYSFRLCAARPLVDEYGRLNFRVCAAIHHVANLVIFHVGCREVVPLVIAMVPRHVRCVRLRNLNHVTDRIVSLGNRHRMNDYALNPWLYRLNDLVEPLL